MKIILSSDYGLDNQIFHIFLELGTRVKLSYDEKEKRRKDIDAKRDAVEAPILAQSGYERIFPVEQKSKMKQYNAFLKMARQCQDQFTHGTIKVDMSILNSM